MKTLLLTPLLLLIAATSKGEIKDTVLKTLKKEKSQITLYVNNETFVFNIKGYGCQWPGLKILDIELRQDLNHRRNFGSDESYVAVGIKNPDHQFCHGISTAQKVFGPEFVPGAELPMQIVKTLQLIQRTSDESHLPKKQKLLRETITLTVNKREVETVAEITLDNPKGE